MALTERVTSKEAEMLEMALVLIANANYDDWSKERTEWRKAAEEWRDKYYLWLSEYVKAHPPTLVPLPPEPAAQREN